ncbi:condensation domain-containing protein, partial [Stenotrophomonas lactitubi]|uniref:condensation domain-containing protein n=1 Tax=Stenotrophomonas lactitubi TaxID=2045214 RepID=UPI001E41107C
VLNVEQVGLDDNFFELGGDSILSIQVVSRARQAGIHFSPRDLFQHQTVQSLAAVATRSELIIAEQGLLTGPSGLTPIQHWFFDTDIPARQHWNQALVLKPLQLLDAHRLEQALLAVLEHHDALRLSFTPRDAQWHAEHMGVPEGGVLLQAQVRDMQACTALFTDTQRSLDLAQGPLLRALLVDGPQGQQRLLIAIHHLVVDGVSWRILLEDLQNVYRQLSDGQSVSLPAKTSALRDWAARLQAYAHSESLREELSLWQAQLAGPTVALPVQRPQGARRNSDAETVSVRLDAERTRQLLQQAPSAYRTQVNDLLLTALARVISRWSEQPAALIQLEGHGREDLFDDIDLSRTVGWFTSLYPVRLHAEG